MVVTQRSPPLDLVTLSHASRVDQPARSGPTEFAVLLGTAAHHAETAANRLLEIVAGAGVRG